MKKFWKALFITFVSITFAAVLALLVPQLVYGEKAVLLAVEQLEKPYVFGAIGPKKFDCSGFTQFCYLPEGIELFHGAKEVAYDDQYLTIPYAWALIPGDLIFFDTVEDDDACDHVGLWIGENKFIHASSSGQRVMISEFDKGWRDRYSWAKRVTCPAIYKRFFSAASSTAIDWAQRYCSIKSP